MEARLVAYRDYLGRSVETTSGLPYIAGRMLMGTLRMSNSVEDGDRAFLASNILDIVAAAFASSLVASNEQRSRHSETLFNRIDRFINHNLNNPDLGPTFVSKSCGISERYLRQLFAMHGMTTTGAIKNKRLDHCHRILSNSAAWRSVTEVALGTGFENVSSFNRAFKARFGVTPRQVRPH
jgi:AraC family transcriptional activator of tynA and feaB